MEEDCIFCGKPVSEGKSNALTDKGCERIAEASIERGVEVTVKRGQEIHSECRRVFCNKIDIEYSLKRQLDSASGEPLKDMSLRSSEPVFNYREHCLFCGKPAKYGGRKKEYDLILVRTFAFQNTVSRVCSTRSDNWSKSVKSRIDFVGDLHAADARYHKMCSGNFQSGKQTPLCFESDDLVSSKRQKLGRPKDSSRHEAFLKVADYLEANDEEQTTIGDLIEKMQYYLGDSQSEAYRFSHMKDRILEHFGTRIIITEINGKPNVVTFRGVASTMLHDFYHQQKEADTEAEKMRLIKTVVQLIKSDIKSIVHDKNVYPSSLDISNTEAAIEYLPESLALLLRLLFVGKDTYYDCCLWERIRT
jgi:hypothetical protein